MCLAFLLFGACGMEDATVIKKPGDNPIDDPPDLVVDLVATGQQNMDGKWLNVRPAGVVKLDEEENPVYAPERIIPDISGIQFNKGIPIIDIDPGTKYQVMTGFGASDAWIVNFLMGGGVESAKAGQEVNSSQWTTEPGLNTKGKEIIADYLFSQEFDENTGQPIGIGLSQWRVNLGAGSWEQGNQSRIGVGAIAGFTNNGSNWQNRAESMLYDIEDPVGVRTETQAAIDGVNVVQKSSGIVYDFRKMKGQRYLMNEARKRGTEKFILFCNSVPVPWTRTGYGNNGEPSAQNNNGKWEPAQRTPNIDINGTRNNGYFIAPDLKSGGTPVNEAGRTMFARYLADTTKYFIDEKYDIQFVSPFNEPQYLWNENKQEGSPWTNAEISATVRKIDAAFKDNGIAYSNAANSGVKIMLSEASRWDHLASGNAADAGDQIGQFFGGTDGVGNSIKGLVTMQPFIIAGHTYFSHNNDADTYTYRKPVRDRAIQFNAPGQSGGVEVYSTEWCALTTGSGFPNANTFYRNALFNAKLTYQDISLMNAVSYAYWTAVCFDYGNARYGLVAHIRGSDTWNTTVSGQNSIFNEKGYSKPQPTLWGTGHYSLFVRPGFQRIGLKGMAGTGLATNTANDYMNLMGSAYISPTGYREFNPETGKYDGEAIDRIVAVYVNMSTSARTVIANIAGDFGGGRVYGGNPSTTKYPKYIRVFMTNFRNTEESNPNVEVEGIPTNIRNNDPAKGPASGSGLRRQPHDGGIIIIPGESMVTVVYDF